MGHGPMQQSSDLPRHGGCQDLGSPAHGRSVDLSCCNSNPFQQNACAAGKEGGKNKASEALTAAAPALPASRSLFAAVQLQKENKTAVASENYN